MSTVAKRFSTILNNRITNHLDDNGLLCNEQNGFRKLRSCLDHIYTFTSIVRNRKLQKLPTYICFVDFAKAFDSWITIYCGISYLKRDPWQDLKSYSNAIF